jgi:hypothetical protein
MIRSLFPPSPEHICFTRIYSSCIVGNGTDGIYSEKRLIPYKCWSFQRMHVLPRTVKYVTECCEKCDPFVYYY